MRKFKKKPKETPGKQGLYNRLCLLRRQGVTRLCYF